MMATISSLAHVRHERIELEPISIAGTVTYGGLPNFPGATVTRSSSPSRFQIGRDRFKSPFPVIIGSSHKC